MEEEEEDGKHQYLRNGDSWCGQSEVKYDLLGGGRDVMGSLAGAVGGGRGGEGRVSVPMMKMQPS